jgi:hypothetical protein
MKRRILLGAAVLVLALTAFYSGNAYAATGCFPDTNGHWAETLICWMKDSGLTGGYPDGTYRAENGVTRAEMAVFLNKLFTLLDTKINQTFATLDTKIDQTSATLDTNIDQTAATLNTKIDNLAASQDAKNSGLILVSSSSGDWKPFSSGDNLSYSYFSSSTYVTRATAGSNFLSLHPSIPTVLYGRSLELVGVEFCYTAQANAYVSYVEINKMDSSSGTGTRKLLFSDPTDRTDSACRYYVLSSPELLTANDALNFFVQGVWVTSTNLNFGRTTFVLRTTDIAAAAPSFPSGIISPAMPGGEDEASTEAP